MHRDKNKESEVNAELLEVQNNFACFSMEDKDADNGVIYISNTFTSSSGPSWASVVRKSLTESVVQSQATVLGDVNNSSEKL